MALNRTQVFELFTSLLIMVVGTALAYFQYSSWMLTIIGSLLFVLSFNRTLRQHTRRNQITKAQHAN